ncbi:flagellar motor protein MotB [Methylobacterium nigriterrae]|uniref:flagellar motor protein MotB n=1 Tax=Methylobacterium nigriterrae TaxID=3127512 RepID=UPI003013FFF0
MLSLRLQSLHRHRAGWLLGLPLLALLWGGATFLAMPSIERSVDDAAERVARETVAETGEPWLRVSIEGRDLVARGEAPTASSREQALGKLAAVSGVRRIVSGIGIVEEASPFAWTATRADRDEIFLGGNRPVDLGRARLAASLRTDLPSSLVLTDETRAARGAPPDFLAAATYAVSRLRDLARGATATVKDTTLSFQGEAIGVAEYDALRTAFANPPQGYSLGRVEILPPTIRDFRFGIERVTEGGLILTGYAVSEAARAKLLAAAAEAADGAFVDDSTQTARGLAAGIDGEALTRFAVSLVELLQDGSVRFEGGTLSVSGHALDAQAIAEAEALMRDRRPAGVGAGTVALSARPLSPYRVTIRRDADAVTVSGHLPDAATRERVLASMRPHFFRERIVDKARLADGAPADLVAALQAAIPRLATLASGEIAATDRSLRLAGESLYAQSARRLSETLPPAMPAAWSAIVAVQARNPAEQRDADTCRRQFASETDGRTLRFEPGSSALRPEFYPVLDALAALAKACPALRVLVAGHADPAGASPHEVRPAPDGGVQSTASIDHPGPVASRAAQAKPDFGRNAIRREEGVTAARKAEAKPAKTHDKAHDKAHAKSGEKPKPSDTTAAQPDPMPDQDLPHQRALAIVEYLLEAGVGADQVAAAPAGTTPGDRQAIAFTLRS